MKRWLLTIALLPSAACVWNPTSRTTQESDAGIALSGYAASGDASVSIRAKNPITGLFEPLTTTTSSPDAAVTTPYAMYPWSVTVTAPPKYWAPQQAPSPQHAVVAQSAGRLELTAGTGTPTFRTFTATAKACVAAALDAGASYVTAGNDCSDGDSIVLYDNSGVGTAKEPPAWVPDTAWTKVAMSPFPIAWSVGHYVVQGKTVYGMVCRPQAKGTYPAQIFNHGLDPAAPKLNASSLDTCQKGAANGWVVALPAFRGQGVEVPGFTVVPNEAVNGTIEMCLGEVIDALRLLDIVAVWNENEVKVDSKRILMWGHSHGGCITERAYEQGAAVAAAVAFAAPTDFAGWYRQCSVPGAACGGTPPGLAFATGGTPDIEAPDYAWRSPLAFADGMNIRRDAKFLALQGTADLEIYPTQACALALTGGTKTKSWYRAPVGSPPGTPAPDAPPGQSLAPGAPTPCSQIAWSTSTVPGATPGAWTADHNLVVYAGKDHFTIRDGIAWADFTNFVKSLGFPTP